MRFVAALCVLISHSIGNYFPVLIKLGGIGVFYFFVLSGFILAYNYQSKILTEAKFSVYQFILKRLVRIYPIYLIVLLLWILLNFSRDIDGLRSIFINFCLLQSFSYALSRLVINPPSWSISVELFFYICFIPIVKISKGSIKRVLLIMCIINFFWFIIYINYISPEYAVWGYYSNPYYRLIDFIGGILLFNIFSRFRFSGTIIERRFLLLLFEMIVFSLPFIFSIIIDGKFLSHIFLYHIIFLLLMMLIFVVIIDSKSILNRFLSSRMLVKLGESSYNLYLIHWLFLFEILKPKTLLNGIISDVIIITCSLLTYKFIEYPLHRTLLNFTNRNFK